MSRLAIITAPAPEPTERNNKLLDALSDSWDVHDSSDAPMAPHGWLTLECSKHYSETVLLALKRNFQITQTEVQYV